MAISSMIRPTSISPHPNRRERLFARRTLLRANGRLRMLNAPL